MQLSHLYVQAHDPFRHLLARFEIFETFGATLSSFEQLGAIFSLFEQFWAILKKLRPFLLGQLRSYRAISSNASLGHVEQSWSIFGNTIWHCQPWTVVKMSQLRLLRDILLGLKQVPDVNPMDLDPQRNQWTYTHTHIYIYIFKYIN